MYYPIYARAEGGKPFSGEPPSFLELWAFGRYDLRLNEEEFWGLTPKELDALSEQYKLNQDWLNYRAALICSVIANCFRSSDKTFTPDDFMPKFESEEQTPDQMLRTVENLNAAFGGKVVEK